MILDLIMVGLLISGLWYYVHESVVLDYEL